MSRINERVWCITARSVLNTGWFGVRERPFLLLITCSLNRLIWGRTEWFKCPFQVSTLLCLFFPFLGKKCTRTCVRIFFFFWQWKWKDSIFGKGLSMCSGFFVSTKCCYGLFWIESVVLFLACTRVYKWTIIHILTFSVIFKEK